jgi:hypothetical protein
LTVRSLRVLKTSSRSTSETVEDWSIVAPSSISAPSDPAGGRVSWTWRLAIPEREKERIVATVPSGSGADPSSTENSTRA